MKKNDIITAEAEGCTRDGAGVVRHEGRAVFVKGALPGELCRIRITKVGSSAVYGRLEELLRPSPERTEPDCPYYPVCGGCAFRHASYEEEKRIKLMGVNDALERIGGLELRADGILGSENILRYRSKSILAAGRDSRGRAVTGFFRPRSHDVISIDGCLLQSAAADRAAAVLRGWMDDLSVPHYDEQSGRGLIRHLFSRLGMVCVVSRARPRGLDELVRRLTGEVDGLRSVVLNINPSEGNTVLSGSFETLWGEDTVSAELGSLRFRLSPLSFFQVNIPQARRLYELAIDYASLTGKENVVDLYCGVGSVGLSAAPFAGHVTGVEIVPSAVENARSNALENGVDNAEFILADAADAAARFAAEGMRPDVLFVDPPRKGLDASVISSIARMGPDRVVCISCDPATLARDLKLFASCGYTAVKASAVDMFPRCGHVETVVCLSNKNAKPKDYVEIGVDAEDYYRIKDSENKKGK